MAEYVYYKKNVNFNLGVRLHPRDNEGVVLSNANPYVNVDKAKIKDFLQANKYHIQSGNMVESAEPSYDFVTANSLDDDQVVEIVKNLFLLKKRLPDISSEAILFKIYEEAKRQKRTQKVLEMIDDRISEVSPVAMRGIDWSAGEDSDDKEGE